MRQESCSTPALITASLPNEKEGEDTNVQNAVLLVMTEHRCSEEEAREICKERTHANHLTTPVLDNLEDGSPLRGGKPSTQNIYGPTRTINSATYLYTQATDIAVKLSNPSCFRIFIEEMHQLYMRQSYDLYGTHNTIRPSPPSHLKMFEKKTGGLFRMLTRLMSDSDRNLLSCLIGCFFQIRDDYQNLASVDYAKQKEFAEDLDEGNYSFTVIHCIQTLESEPKFADDSMQLRAFLMKRRF